MDNTEAAAKLIVLRRELYDLYMRVDNLIRELLDTEQVEE